MHREQAQTLVVASQNPVKIEATRRGFASMFPGRAFHLHPVEVPSGVRPQPLSDAETLQGALKRVQHAAHLVPQAAYWVGIEGGVEECQGAWKPLPGLWSQHPLSPAKAARELLVSLKKSRPSYVRGTNSLQRSRRCISTRR
jgi:hypothetical protein